MRDYEYTCFCGARVSEGASPLCVCMFRGCVEAVLGCKAQSEHTGGLDLFLYASAAEPNIHPALYRQLCVFLSEGLKNEHNQCSVFIRLVVCVSRNKCV